MIAELPTPTRAGLLRVAGAGLLFATAAIHLDLYLTGYRNIPTIGWLFLLQVIAGFGLGIGVLLSGHRLVTAAAAGFALATLGGYLLSVQFGLFGFREVRTTAGIVAAVIEVAGFAVLAVLAAAAPAAQHADRALAGRSGRSVPHAGPLVAGVCLLAFGLVAGALAGSGGAVPLPGAQLRTTTIGGATVLTNSAGRTLYWFAADTSSTSACYGSCAQYWPPMPGPDSAGPGVVGRLGTIRRTGGTRQETYNGHPLYTYVGDSGPGQAHGNDLNLNGGRWHEVVVQ